ncbi:MAG: hypothetical protein MR051_01685 [Lentisphaeria bacterium]|nr:hypothetical protein [Lentisphaeria bacterium]
MDFQTEDLKKIATFQRMMILAVAIQLVLTIAIKFVPWLGILTLAASVFCLYTMIMVSQALKHETPMTVLYAICAFIPIVSLIALYLLAKKSSDALKAAGYSVGFFGMSKEDIDKIR